MFVATNISTYLIFVDPQYNSGGRHSCRLFSLAACLLFWLNFDCFYILLTHPKDIMNTFLFKKNSSEFAKRTVRYKYNQNSEYYF